MNCEDDIDMEAIENMLDAEKTVNEAGYLSVTHFEECKRLSEKGMIKYGDPFTRALGDALVQADRCNALRIMRYWLPLCETHATLYKMYLAKRRILPQNDMNHEI